MSDRRFGYEEFGVGLFVGLAVGAVVAILATPQSGRETREKLTDVMDMAKDQFTDVYEKSKNLYEMAYERLESVVGSGDQSFKRKLDELKEDIQKYQTNEA